jgi:S-adenosylmethionine:tRNA ribosyltransferase-isomerase
MHISELDYELPDGLIATQPASPRDSARLMLIRREAGSVEHLTVAQLPTLVGADARSVLHPGDLIIFNKTRVVPARFGGVRSRTGGRIGGLFLRELPGETRRWLTMLESRGVLTQGETIDLGHESRLVLEERLGGGEWRATLESPLSTVDLLHHIGATPLPPYIVKERKSRGEQTARDEDASRYNTIFAQDPGSVAAPTAGLHFTPGVLAQLDSAGVAHTHVTLHVGLGTFAPIRVERVEDHNIHSEWFEISTQTLDAIARTRAAGGRILVVGTTSVRALESLPENALSASREACHGDTRLLITPGFRFRFTDLLMTNFHLPRSSLLALVAAVPGVGAERLRGWYAQAIAERYRFYSFGDAMLLA